MAEGARERDWSLLSHLLALIANCNRDPKKHSPFTASDFNPTIPIEQKENVVTDMEEVKKWMRDHNWK